MLELDFLNFRDKMPVKLLTEGLVKDSSIFENVLQSNKIDQIKYFKSLYSSKSDNSSTSSRESTQNNILIDWLISCTAFASQQLLFDSQQVNIFLAIIYDLHQFSCSTCFSNQRKAYEYMSELLLAHSVNKAPWKLSIFLPQDIRKMADFIVENYFRHFNLYKFCFTDEEQIDLKLVKGSESGENTATSIDTSDLSKESQDLILECQRLQISANKDKISRQLEHEIGLVVKSIQAKSRELAPKSGKK